VDLEIRTQNVTLQPEWRTLIEQRIARLESRYPELMRLQVTLKHGEHHQQGFEEASILASAAGTSLRAGKQKEDMGAALHAALDAIERELDAHHDRRRHFVKAPGPRVQGTIRRLFAKRGYGFIAIDGGKDVYFHRNALHELDFASLRTGLPVEIEIEEGERGPQASCVFPAGERSSI